MEPFGTFLKKESFLPSKNSLFLSQCLEKGGKIIADTEIGFAKNAVKKV